MIRDRDSRSAARAWLKLKLGRRGCMLLTLAFVYMLVGYAEITMPNPAVPEAFLLYVPRQIRGAVWIASGMIAFVYAWRKRDRFGWIVLYLMPALRMLSYAGAYSAALLGFGGSDTAWVRMVGAAPYLLIVLICSGWPEQSDTPPPTGPLPGHYDRED